MTLPRETLETLARVPLFDTVPREVLRHLAAASGESNFPSGTEVVREGDADGAGFFVIVSGEASVAAGGVEIGTLGDGDHFGAVATIDGRARTATVRATTELRCVILTDAAFHELVHDHPGVAWRLLLYLSGLLRRDQPAGAVSAAA